MACSTRKTKKPQFNFFTTVVLHRRLHRDNFQRKMAAELEETLKRLVQNKAVIGTMVINSDGIPIKSTLDIHVTTQYSGLINQLVDQGRVIIYNGFEKLLRLLLP